jgi:nucleotide-binding universal stress UspA family protein
MMAKSKQVLEYKPQKFEEVRTVLIRHILVPFDGSNYSYTAFDFALDLAKKYGAKISVISVMYSSIMSSSFLDITAHQTSIEKTQLRALLKEFNGLKEHATKFKIPFTSDVIMSSSVAQTILSFASSQKADMIIMGTRGRTGGPSYLRLGSVAMNVSQNSSCPVMFVK